MIELARSLAAPLTSLVFLIMGSGLLNTFVSIRLEMEGFSAETIGIVSSALYVGILLGSIWLGRWIGKVGHIRAFAMFAWGATALVLAQALWIDPIYWSALRLIAGVCTAGIFIVIESWLLMESPAPLRGAVLSLYLALFYAALSGGQFLINLSDPKSPYPFCITAALFAVSVIPISRRKTVGPRIEASAPLSTFQLYRLSPLGFFGGIVSGMLLAAVYSLVPVYAQTIGLGISEVGTLMGVIIFGGLSFQWPLGRWADRGSRRFVLMIVSFATALFGLGIAYWTLSFPLLLIFGWFFGGFSFTLYPLSMAYTCEKIPSEQIVAATGGFVLSYAVGAIAGPLIAPLAMSLCGIGGLFYFLAAITFFLGLGSVSPRFSNEKRGS